MRNATDLERASSSDQRLGSRGPRPLDDAPMALLAGAAAGATICAIQFMIVVGGLAGGSVAAEASTEAVLWGCAFVLIAWLVAALGFFIGLLFIGLPVWAGFDRLGWTSAGAAIGAGAVLSALVAGLLGGPLSAGFLLLPGAAAGWGLHRVAYAGRPR